jgi:REP element-mobilizing transposase RayT
MANTYTSLHYHIVFSTKNREFWINQDVEHRVWAYLGGIAKQHKMTPLQIGGIEDHVHLLLGAPTVLAPAKMVQLLKGGSSAWIHEALPRMEGFGWQDGYGAFTVSRSKVPSAIEYIQGQREHHRTKSFQDEYRELLKRHEIAFDERYAWG